MSRHGSNWSFIRNKSLTCLWMHTRARAHTHYADTPSFIWNGYINKKCITYLHIFYFGHFSIKYIQHPSYTLYMYKEILKVSLQSVCLRTASTYSVQNYKMLLLQLIKNRYLEMCDFNTNRHSIYWFWGFTPIFGHNVSLQSAHITVFGYLTSKNQFLCKTAYASCFALNQRPQTNDHQDTMSQ